MIRIFSSMYYTCDCKNRITIKSKWLNHCVEYRFYQLVKFCDELSEACSILSLIRLYTYRLKIRVEIKMVIKLYFKIFVLIELMYGDVIFDDGISFLTNLWCKYYKFSFPFLWAKYKTVFNHPTMNSLSIWIDTIFNFMNWLVRVMYNSVICIC